MADQETLARPSRSAYQEAGNAIQRAGFGSTETELRRETQSTALAERAKAEIQARYIVALQRPRQWEDVWARLIKDCNRPGFAEVAMYRVKRGKKQDEHNRWVDNYVEGFTVGFAMSAMRTMGNIDGSYSTVYEDDERVIYRVSITDVESNVTQSKDVRVAKRVERSYVREGQRVISSRENSEGKVVYLVEATDEEMENKVASMISKAKRNLVLDVLPSDIKDDCRATVKATRVNTDKADPAAAKKRLIAAFFSLGISPEALAQFLGHPLEQIQPAHLVELRNIHEAIRDGETTWAEVTRGEAEPAPDTATSPAPSGTASKIRDHLAKRKEPP